MKSCEFGTSLELSGFFLPFLHPLCLLQDTGQFPAGPSHKLLIKMTLHSRFPPASSTVVVEAVALPRRGFKHKSPPHPPTHPPTPGFGRIVKIFT